MPPSYLTLDIDCVDPSFAPGTGTPEIGGLSTSQVDLAVILEQIRLQIRVFPTALFITIPNHSIIAAYTGDEHSGEYHTDPKLRWDGLCGGVTPF